LLPIFFNVSPTIKELEKNGVFNNDVVCIFVPKLPEYDVPKLYKVSVEYKFDAFLFK
jgi:hypothetical protein